MEIKIIGKIELPLPITKVKRVYCDDCGMECNMSNGDPREKITTTYHNGNVEVRWICLNCVWLQWGQFEPDNIFDGRSDINR